MQPEATTPPSSKGWYGGSLLSEGDCVQPNTRPGLRNTPPGWIQIASCNSSHHKGPQPVDQLIRKFGDLALVEFAVVGLKSAACEHPGTSALMLRPNEPGCPRHQH